MDHPFDDAYVICTRRVRQGQFESEPGKALYLRVPSGRNPRPEDKIVRRVWFDEVRDRADGNADNRLDPAGDVLVFIHGYNSDQDTVVKRHRQLQTDLWGGGFSGIGGIVRLAKRLLTPKLSGGSMGCVRDGHRTGPELCIAPGSATGIRLRDERTPPRTLYRCLRYPRGILSCTQKGQASSQRLEGLPGGIRGWGHRKRDACRE